jgi:hypothetical protein
MLRNDAEAVPCAVTVKPIRLLGEAAGKGRPPLRSAPPSCDDASAGLTAALGSRSGAATPASGATVGAHMADGGGSAGDRGLNGGVHGLAGAQPQPPPHGRFLVVALFAAMTGRRRQHFAAVPHSGSWPAPHACPQGQCLSLRSGPADATGQCG